VRSIVIVGAGDLGGALARQLAAADIVPRITLVDDAGTVARGKALDIAQAAPVDGYTTSVQGATDESAVVGADVVVIADRAASQAEWQDDAGVALARRIAYFNPAAAIVCAGWRQMDLVDRGVREGGISGARLFGTAPEALRAAVISMVALEAQCPPAEVALLTLGRPPGQIIVPWQDAAIAGRPATEALRPPAIARLEQRLPRLWPPGPLTLASAATRVLRAAATRRGDTVCAFVAVTRAQGGSGRAAMLPVRVSAARAEALPTPQLTVRDRVRLDGAVR
jgi:malate dehydrogenase